MPDNPGIKIKLRLFLRKLFSGIFLVFLLTLFTLLGRHFNWGPLRGTPDYRDFGPLGAPVVVEEFTDLSCPACKKGNELIRGLMEIYPGHLNVRFKHFPLEMHKWSFSAAVCSECAGRQGKFYPYADNLFKKQGDWSESKETPSIFALTAEELKLDLKQFEECRKDPSVAKTVRLDMEEGEARGVAATPTFFLNRKRSVGAGRFLETARTIDGILGRRSDIIMPEKKNGH